MTPKLLDYPSFQIISVPDFWEILKGSNEVEMISTVELLVPHSGGIYETCVFSDTDGPSVVERYETLDEAIKGHNFWENDLSVTKRIVEKGLKENI